MKGMKLLWDRQLLLLSHLSLRLTLVWRVPRRLSGGLKMAMMGGLVPWGKGVSTMEWIQPGSQTASAE